MSSASVSRRFLLPILAGIAIALVGALQFEKLAADRTLLKPYDFVQYWSAGRLLLDGGDPYDPDEQFAMQRTINDTLPKVIMMWNPPWALPVTLPFAALPWRLAQFLWFGMQLAAVLASVDMLWRLDGGEPGKRWIAGLLALTFAPTIFLLLIGQISGLLLLGISGFLFFMRRDRPTIAGVFGALAAIKPHLVLLFALVFVLEAIRQPLMRRAVVAGLGCLLIGALLPLIWDPHVWKQYVVATGQARSETFDTMRDFKHPTIGYMLRTQIPGQPFVAQFVPLALALAGLVVCWLAIGRSIDWLDAAPWLVLLSALTAAYGAWAFDLVLLLVPLTQMATWLSRSRNRVWIAVAVGIYLLWNLLVLRTINEDESQANRWITPVVLAAFGIGLALHRRAERKAASNAMGVQI